MISSDKCERLVIQIPCITHGVGADRPKLASALRESWAYVVVTSPEVVLPSPPLVHAKFHSDSILNSDASSPC
jgi:hypothetical protein